LQYFERIIADIGARNTMLIATVNSRNNRNSGIQLDRRMILDRRSRRKNFFDKLKNSLAPLYRPNSAR
jgi:hypothetical protein